MSKNMFITAEVWRADGEIEWLKYDDEIYRFDLSKDATAGMVDMMIAALASYNDIGGKHKEFVLNTLIKKMKNRELVILGGIHFQDDSTHIFNGCCCGMEEWSLIVDMLKANMSPWMGHDPDVCCSEKEGIYYVSNVQLVNTGTIYYHENADGEIVEYDPGMPIEDALADERYKVISYEKELFMELLEKVEEDFNNFVEYPLKERLLQLTSEKTARAFMEAFCTCFGRERRQKMNA